MNGKKNIALYVLLINMVFCSFMSTNGMDKNGEEIQVVLGRELDHHKKLFINKRDDKDYMKRVVDGLVLGKKDAVPGKYETISWDNYRPRSFPYLDFRVDLDTVFEGIFRYNNEQMKQYIRDLNVSEKNNLTKNLILFLECEEHSEIKPYVLKCCALKQYNSAFDLLPSAIAILEENSLTQLPTESNRFEVDSMIQDVNYLLDYIGKKLDYNNQIMCDRFKEINFSFLIKLYDHECKLSSDSGQKCNVSGFDYEKNNVKRLGRLNITLTEEYQDLRYNFDFLRSIKEIKELIEEYSKLDIPARLVK